ncbi:MAG: type II toxin-antitoxin system PemK/MazF family toxin [Actinomycetia bacterium]|nr:type II toxin-antitoxin system PemK/MazF family toxin [Actinomycetes bacterium]
MPAQGDIWWAEAEDKRRPMLIVTRTEAIPVLTWILVAPVTRTIRGIPTEVNLDTDDGMPAPCVAAFDNLQPIRRTFLTDFLGSISHRRTEMCRALMALSDC